MRSRIQVAKMSLLCRVAGLSLSNKVEFGQLGEAKNKAAAPPHREGLTEVVRVSA